MLNRIKIGPKLIGGFALVATLAAGVGIYAIRELRTVAETGNTLYERGAKPLGTLIVLTENYQRSRVNLRDSILKNDPAAIQDFLQRYGDCQEEVLRAADLYEQLCMTDECRRQTAELKGLVAEYHRFATGLRPLIEGNQDEAALSKLLGEGAAIATPLREAIGRLVQQKVEHTGKLNEANTAAADSANTGIIAVLTVSVGLAVLLGVFLTTSITRPLRAAAEMLQEMGKGHLSGRLNLTRTDEIGLMARTMDQFSSDLQTYVVGVLKKIAGGDVSMTVQAKGPQDEIAPALEQLVQSLRGLIAEATGLQNAAIEGRLSARSNAAAYSGAWREILQGFNQTLDAVLQPINEAAQVLERIADRDLTARVQGNYQGDHARIKNAINQAVDNLDTGLQQVAVSAAQVASASGQISSGSQSLAQGASEQAGTLEEVASSLQEVTSMAASNAAFAQEAQTLAAQARESSTNGMRNMEQLSEAIRKIKASSDETAKIVRTIDEIAFQTNLLALNAAVEAARAGEAGKGFAVVAEEVRNLAIRCAEAAKSTANLIEQSVKSSEEGVQINVQVLQDLQEIARQVERVSQGMQEIATASEQQRQGIDQVNAAVEQMSQLTQSSAANAEESASAAEELNSQAEELNQLVAGFRLSSEAAAIPGVAAAQPAAPRPHATPLKVNGKDRNWSAHRKRLVLEDPAEHLAQF